MKRITLIDLVALAFTFVPLAMLVVADKADAQCNGTTTLSWQPPTKNTDGSNLTNLAGYRFFWGTSPGVYPNSVTVNNPALLSYPVTGLCAGLWYFVAIAYNTNGVDSAYSTPPATKLIQGSTPTAPQIPAPKTVGGRVRTLLITTNASLMPDVGSVAAGVVCDDKEQHLKDGVAYMRVNVASVTPDPGIKLEAAWAVCK